MTQDVDPDALFDAARVYNNVRTSAASAVNELASVLNGSAGMGGTDTGAHAWAIQYDPLATSLIEAATVVVEGAGQCYDLLYATGMNHLNADGQSAISGEAVLAMPPMGAPSFNTPAVPLAEGGHSDVPEWWHTVTAYVQGELWPNGHQDNLRTAADAWISAARDLRAAAQLVNGGPSSMGAIAPLMDQKSPEFPNLIKNRTMVRDQMRGVADGCDEAAKACSTYAQAIDDAHSKIIHEMVVLGATVAVTEIVAANFSCHLPSESAKPFPSRRCLPTGGDRLADRHQLSESSGWPQNSPAYPRSVLPAPRLARYLSWARFSPRVQRSSPQRRQDEAAQSKELRH